MALSSENNAVKLNLVSYSDGRYVKLVVYFLKIIIEPENPRPSKIV